MSRALSACVLTGIAVGIWLLVPREDAGSPHGGGAPGASPEPAAEASVAADVASASRSAPAAGGPRSRVLRAKLVDPRGRPLGGREWWSELRSARGGMRLGRRSSSDEEGHVEVRIEHEVDGEAWSWTLRDFDAANRSRWGAETQAHFTMTEPAFDAGALECRPLPLVAYGRVVDEHEDPVPGARLQISALDASDCDAGEFTWTEVPELEQTCSETGRFEIRASLHCARVRLEASHEGRLHAVAVSETGRGGTTLVLRSPGGIRGRLLLPDAMRPSECEVVVRALDTRTLVPASVDADGDFEIRGLSEGTWELFVLLALDPRPLLEVRGLSVLEGETCLDPRLDPLDLRSRIHLVEARIEDEDGAPVELAHAYLLPEPAARGTAERRRPGFLVHEGRLRAWSRDENPYVELHAAGFAALESRLHAGRRPRLLTLRRTAPQRLVITSSVPWPDDRDWWVLLEREPDGRLPFVYQVRTESGMRWSGREGALASDRAWSRLVEGRADCLPRRPGRYGVRIGWSRGGGAPVAVPLASPREELVIEDVFHENELPLELPPGAFDDLRD